MKPIILIPAYQPDQKLMMLVQQLTQHHVGTILIVNDGSGTDCDVIFSALSALPDVTLLVHEKNQGKGAALKTGFHYCQQHYSLMNYTVITVDADGQHAIADIQQLAEAALASPHSFILGVRNFTDVPLRSKFGNTLTKWVFSKLYRTSLQDTQTGLRVIPAALIPTFLNINSNCYEFETECLINAVRSTVDIKQIGIQTIYIDNNRSSHFRPIRDSVKIYLVFFRFMLSSLASCAVDFTLFVLLYRLVGIVFFSLLIARASSAVLNFQLNKYKVYRLLDKTYLYREMRRYGLLAFSVFWLSYFLIQLCVTILPFSVVTDKVLVDFLLFLSNFFVQRYVVFR